MSAIARSGKVELEQDTGTTHEQSVAPNRASQPLARALDWPRNAGAIGRSPRIVRRQSWHALSVVNRNFSPGQATNAIDADRVCHDGGATVRAGEMQYGSNVVIHGHG